MSKYKKIIITYLFLLVTVSCSDTDVVESNLSKNNDESKKESKLEPKVVYGDDNRLDLYEVTNANHLRVADATVALVDSRDLLDKGSYYNLNTTSYGKSLGLCTKEPFYEQQTIAYCSGFLVGKNKMITAGHCIPSQSSCVNTNFVFGFSVKSNGVLPTQVLKSEVYSCKTLVAQHLDGNGADYAVVELDRNVVGHQPLKIRRSGSLSKGDQLYVVGHPSGLPTKVAHDASVREVKNGYVVANLDTYGGNSGSAVFNALTHKVEGILVRGEVDFVSSVGGCRITKKCTNSGCRGEDVTQISEVLSHVPALLEDDNNGGGVNDQEPELVDVSVSSNEVVKIPDYNLHGISSKIVMSESPKGRRVSVKINLAHTWRGDLVVQLKSPSGQILVLQNRQGRNLDNIIGEYGVDLVSQDDLTSLSKESVKGTWKLSISDRARFDRGQLNSWSIKFSK